MSKINLINELIETILEEIDQSSSCCYECKDGTVITTDVGYVGDWFNEYVDVLRRRYDE